MDSITTDSTSAVMDMDNMNQSTPVLELKTTTDTPSALPDQLQPPLTPRPRVFTVGTLPKACPPESMIETITAVEAETTFYPAVCTYDFQVSKK